MALPLIAERRRENLGDEQFRETDIDCVEAVFSRQALNKAALNKDPIAAYVVAFRRMQPECANYAEIHALIAPAVKATASAAAIPNLWYVPANRPFIRLPEAAYMSGLWTVRCHEVEIDDLLQAYRVGYPFAQNLMDYIGALTLEYGQKHPEAVTSAPTP